MCGMFMMTATDEECREAVRKIEAACRSHSAAVREGVAGRWWRVGLDDTGHPEVEEIAPPDYACGGVEVSAADDSMDYFLWDMGWTLEKRWQTPYYQEMDAALARGLKPQGRVDLYDALVAEIEDMQRDELMASVRDIARGS